MGDLTTYAKVKTSLGLTDDTEQTEIARLITAASKKICQICDRDDFISAVYTEYQDGTGTNQLYVRNWPITAITSIYDDELRNFTDEAYLIASSYYFAHPTMPIITLLYGLTFLKAISNVKIVYTAGYSTIPADVDDACIELVKLKYNKKGSRGVESEKIGSYSVTYSKEDIPQDILDTLTPYMRMVFE